MQNQQLIPKLGFGTYGRNGKDGIGAILCALETGYRHLDTAQTYDTEFETGEALRRSAIARREVFMTTKISTDNFGEGKLIPSLEKSLEAMRIDQFDLTLIHWPAPNGAIPLEVYLSQIAEAQERGLTRLIGVSNFTIALLQQAESIVGKGRIINNQFELNPLIQNKKLADYCQRNDILVTCYLPIARGTLSGDPVLGSIADHHAATVEQVIIAFELAKGYCAIPTSSRAERIRSNFAAGELRLKQDEVALIEALDRNHRTIDPDWGPDWD
ncbi:aldo/keto reductase [Rhizobium leguminosarum]|uniref:aldo/keto reductase n=1 Tax=Rhizobium leguminosarum TaxID=384 RepID=UPI0013D9F2F3|nr:aldo/keto reductase [Rhizobium leguminosarum]MBY5317134.1 aldo/keto reductase [Rhizobium leguminosarum]NEH52595.1 aldo/keto reductase [Rhizobium leguminosarum]